MSDNVLYRVMGKIVDVNHEGTNTFVEVRMKSGKQCNVKIEQKLPINIEDNIRVLCSKGKNIYISSKHPLIIPSEDTYEMEVRYVSRVVKSDEESAVMTYANRDASIELVKRYLSISSSDRFEVKLAEYWVENRYRRQLELFGLKKGLASELVVDLVNLGLKGITSKCLKIPKIPMDICDRIIESADLSFTKDELRRARICRYVYENREKHSFMSTPERFVRNKYPDIERHIEELKEYQTIFDLGHFYYAVNYYDETLVTNHLIEMKDDNERDSIATNLDEMQTFAMMIALRNNVSIITGMAGTGKSRVMKDVALNSLNEVVYLAAPTGVVVNNIKKVIDLDLYENFKISTVHKLLYLKQEELTSNDIHLIIDETSMITTGLMAAVFRKWGDQITRVTYIGDVNQLPPISSGYFFREIIDSEVFSQYSSR